MTNPT